MYHSAPLCQTKTFQHVMLQLCSETSLFAMYYSTALCQNETFAMYCPTALCETRLCQSLDVFQKQDFFAIRAMFLILAKVLIANLSFPSY
ncbi:hypothetical protein CEXT_230511 [Caerostris extrusa]|uniref:Uncharacterized protein n=1 Tax=Caerostris extrusa TaxID=172846 RepID=A0AAV4U9N0_CAEEX|nr:hypothetical protein CEXT_230511 [Caerostris extrusa]